MIRIIAKKDGFRRAGMAHSSEPKDYPNNHFTPEQLEALKNEKMLVVQELPDPKPAGTGDNPEGDDSEGEKGKGKGKKKE